MDIFSKKPSWASLIHGIHFFFTAWITFWNAEALAPLLPERQKIKYAEEPWWRFDDSSIWDNWLCLEPKTKSKLFHETRGKIVIDLGCFDVNYTCEPYNQQKYCLKRVWRQWSMKRERDSIAANAARGFSSGRWDALARWDICEWVDHLCIIQLPCIIQVCRVRWLTSRTRCASTNEALRHLRYAPEISRYTFRRGFYCKCMTKYF